MSTEVKIRQITKTFARVIINGTDKGEREINGGPSLKEFATSLAQEFGVRSFNVTVDGELVRTAEQASSPVRDGSSVAVQARDTRGTEGDEMHLGGTEHEEAAASNEGMPEAQADGDPVTTEPVVAEPGDGATA